MQRTCQRCGREADTGRFCRQCGAPLFAENETTSAATRQYQSHQPPSAQPVPSDAPYTSPGYPAPDTARLYRAPSMPPYAVPPPRKSNAALWIVLSIACFIVVCGIASAILVPRIIAWRQAPRFDPRAQFPPVRIEPPIRAPQAPPAPPAPPPARPPSGKAVNSLEDLKYPNVTDSQKVNLFGSGAEILQMRTNDDFEDVKQFYQDRLGTPMSEDDDKVVFIAEGQKKITVTISPDKRRKGQFLIKVIYVDFSAPNHR